MMLGTWAIWLSPNGEFREESGNGFRKSFCDGNRFLNPRNGSWTNFVCRQYGYRRTGNFERNQEMGSEKVSGMGNGSEIPEIVT